MSVHGAGWQTMHSFRRDPSVTQRRLTRDTYARILRLARPYRGQLAVFLLLALPIPPLWALYHTLRHD